MPKTPKQFDSPSVSDVHVDAPLGGKKKELSNAFLKHLHGQIKETSSDLTLGDLKGMIAKSRSHAGGKTKAANRQSAQTASEGTNYSKIIEMINAELREEFSSPLYGMGCYPWAREVYDDHVIVSDDEGGFYTIPYTMNADGDIEFGDAQEVEQTFMPIAAGEIIARCADGAGYRLFMEQQFVEPPEWINYLPGPGSYTHPEYGKIDITKEGNQQFVDQFNEGIYQTYNDEPHVPIDAEHQTKLSGAVGWINELRLNEDDSVDAKTDWTDRGQKLLESDQYHFFSPEWYSEWTDPATEKTYQNVAIGGAITTRPWFKEKGGLRPIVANEKGIQFGEIKRDGSDVTIIFTALAPDKGESMTKAQIEAARKLVEAADAKTASEVLTGKSADDIKAARVLVASEDARIAKEAKEDKPETPEAKSFAEVQAQLKQMTERVTAAETEAKKANERADATEKGNRAMRFGEMAKAWPGEKADNVATLEHLFATNESGEGSDLFKAHVKTMSAAAAQLKNAGLFTELGSAGGNESGAVTSEVETAVAKQMSEKAGTTKEQAFTVVWETLTPEKREGYRQEQRSVN